MKIYAAIKGLELLKQPRKVTFDSDSQHLADAIMRGWTAKWNKNGWWLNKLGENRFSVEHPGLAKKLLDKSRMKTLRGAHACPATGD